MHNFVFTVVLTLGLFCGMLIFLQVGRILGLRRKEGGSAPGIGVIEGSIFALMGLVIAFSFSGALTWFDWRRGLDVEEANAIGTAYLRLDLLPAPDRPALRALFRGYVETRLGVYEKVSDIKAFDAEFAKLSAIQAEIWKLGLAASQRADSNAAPILLMPALNSMFDILTTQTMAARTHPPAVVFAMLIGLALISSLLIGFDLARDRERHWIHVIGFALAISFSLYVILDLEYPRLGLIHIGEFDKPLMDLLAQMK